MGLYTVSGSTAVQPFTIGTHAIDDGLIGHWSATKDTTGASPLEEITSNWGNIDTGAGTWESDTTGNGVRRITSTAAAEYALVIPGFMGTFSAFSVSMWHRQVQFRADSGVFGQWFSGEALPLLCRLTGTMEIQTYCIADGGSQVGGNTGLTLTASGWNHIVMTWDAVNGLRTFLDTAEGSSAPANGSGLTFINTRPTTWGGEIGSTARGTDNSVDVLRLYDRALSPAEVTELYDAGRGEAFQVERQSYNELFGKGSHSVPDELEGSWLLQDDPTGGTAADDSGQGRTGTINGNITTAVNGPKAYLPNSMRIPRTGTESIEWAHASWQNPSSITLLGYLQVASDARATNAWMFGKWGGATVAAYQVGLRIYSAFNPISTKSEFYDSAATSNADEVTAPTLNSEQWYHYAATYQAGTNKQYIDGALRNTASDATGSLNANANTPMQIGNTGDQADQNNFQGWLAGAAFFSKVLTAAEVAQAYNGPEPYFSSAPSAPTGTTEVGEVLTVQTDTIVDPNNGSITYTFQWVRADDNTGTGETLIAGATNATYTLQAADNGKYVAVLITPSNDGGSDPAEQNTRSSYTDQIGGVAPTFKPHYAVKTTHVIQRSI